jgi:hypothetical protein
MEFYGSIGLISGSVTASVLSGSFKGDASGLYNIQASGVTGLNLSQIANGSNTASISPNGFNVNTDTSITGSLKVSGTITAEQYDVTVVSSSILYQSGSTKFGDSLDDNHNITGSVNITGSISLNGEPIGTGKLNETTFNSYVTASDSKLGNIETSTGSLNSFTSSINTSIKNKLNTDNVVSGSAQVNVTGTTGYSTFSSSISTSIGDVNSTLTNLSSSVATTDLSQNNRLDTIESRYATTGSNIFKGTQTMSGSIIPSVDNLYDLGSVTHQWRDVYISSGSLYIDGTKVLSSTNQELTITTDTGQSLKILEGTTDSIIIQTADGDVELKSSGDGDILLDPTNGKIMLKGPVEILSGQKIQSSVGGTPVVFANDIVVSGSIDITGTIEGINLTDFSSSLNTRIGNNETSITSINSFTSSASTRLDSLETESGSIRTTVNSHTSSVNGRLSSIETVTGSILTTNTAQDGRLTSIEGKTGSFATTGSNVFQGNQTITGSLYVSQDLIIAGSSSIQHISSSVVNIADNIITVNAQNPSIRFGGLAVIDSGSSPQVSGSILFDSINDQWIFVHQNQSTITSSVLLMGPETFNNLGGETYLTLNRIPKGSGIEHLRDSNISDNGTTVTILSNTVINGTISSTGTTLVSGSSQVSFNGITDKPTLVSGSSQVSFTGISDRPTLVSGSSQITFSGITSLPTLVSGSGQISFTGLSNIPGGLVSGSSQIDLTSTTNYSSGIKTRLNAESVVSGSAQITGIGNSQLTNSSFHVGTTSISLGRTSAAQTLNGVSIDGNAGSASYALKLDGYANQTLYTILDGPANGPVWRVRYDSATVNRYVDLGFKDGNGTFYEGFKIYNNATPTWAGSTIWHQGNLTNLNQLTNGPGYITSDSTKLPLTGGTMTGPIAFSNVIGTKIDFYHETSGSGDRYGVQVQSSELRIHSGSGGASTGGITFGRSTTSTFTEHLRIRNDGNVIPGSNGTQNLGSSTLRWNTIFTSDLSLSNGIGDYTIVEGENDLFLYNNKQNKVYKFMLQEVNPNDATPKRPE